MHHHAGMVIGGRYQLVEAVAEGGMAHVWKGVTCGSEVFARPIAIKLMKGGFATLKPMLSMFFEEARIGAELQHPHLIQVLDFVESSTAASYCLVLEWIEGIDLRSLVRTMARLDRPLPWALVAHIGVGVLRGLAVAHERRLPDGTAAPVIHRDVSPQNILLGLNGAIKLTDFGLARARDGIAERTMPGIVKGTISYMSPEVLMGKNSEPASDQFSLACTLWEALAGERLFDGKEDIDVVRAIRLGQVRPIDERRPDLPPRLAAAIHRALAVDPAKRFPSVRAMTQELGEVLRQCGPWVDSDIIIGTFVAQARQR
jgi:serine/threonine protein kinase